MDCLGGDCLEGLLGIRQLAQVVTVGTGHLCGYRRAYWASGNWHKLSVLAPGISVGTRGLAGHQVTGTSCPCWHRPSLWALQDWQSIRQLAQLGILLGTWHNMGSVCERVLMDCLDIKQLAQVVSVGTGHLCG